MDIEISNGAGSIKVKGRSAAVPLPQPGVISALIHGPGNSLNYNISQTLHLNPYINAGKSKCCSSPLLRKVIRLCVWVFILDLCAPVFISG